MFDAEARMEDITSSLRLIAELSLPVDPVRDIVEAHPLAEKAWQRYVKEDPRLKDLQPNTVSYHVIRGLWMMANCGVKPLPPEKVHLAYAVPYKILQDVVAQFGEDGLSAIFDQPGALDLLIYQILSSIYPPHVVMWGEEHAETVHELLDRLLAMDPTKPNYAEQVEAWIEDARQRLPEDIARYVVDLGMSLVAQFLKTDSNQDEVQEVDEEEEQDSSSTTGSAQGQAMELPLLAYDQMVALYEKIRSKFVEKTLGADSEEMEEVSISEPLVMAIAKLRDEVAMFGMIEGESYLVKNLDMQSKALALKYLQQDRIREILEKFGRLVGLMESDSARDSNARNDENTESSRIQDLNAAGFNLLATDEVAFDGAYASGTLPTYDRGARGEKGPIICCLDNSGSMSGAPDVWSKATLLALAEEAYRQNRPFAGILFDHDVRTRDVVLAVPPSDAGKVFELVLRVPNGGTNFEAALQEAMRIMDSNSTWRDADIIFITDGDSVVTKEFLRRFNEFKKDRQVKVHTILINMGHASVSKESVSRFSDTVRLVSELTDDAAGEILTLV